MAKARAELCVSRDPPHATGEVMMRRRSPRTVFFSILCSTKVKRERFAAVSVTLEGTRPAARWPKTLTAFIRGSLLRFSARKWFWNIASGPNGAWFSMKD